MKEVLGKYERERGDRKFVYGRVGSLELYIYPKDNPANVNKTNVKRLLSELPKIELEYHLSCEKAKNELLSYLPEEERNKFLPEGAYPGHKR